MKGSCTILFFFTWVFIIPVFGQFSEDFGDGDFTSDPAWSGDTTFFKVVSGRMQLSAPPAAGTARIFTPSSATRDVSWQFRVGLDFNPSASNYCDVYLMSDLTDPVVSSAGYFVRIGGSRDAVSLFRKDGTSVTELIPGLSNVLDSSAVELVVKVERHGIEDWILNRSQLFDDSVTILEGQVTDSTWKYAQYTGVVCTFTSTRADKMWFDDFEVKGFMYKDHTPPKVEGTELLNSNQVSIQFSEALDLWQLNTSCFSINQMKAESASADSTGTNIVVRFAKAFVHGQPFELFVANVSDTAGNIMPEESLSLLFNDTSRVEPKEVIMTELMPDPSPPKGLPESEYIEIQNRGNHWLNLNHWLITDRRDTAVLPRCVLGPDERLVLVDSGDIVLWAGRNMVIGLEHFPGLNNDGDDLLIISPGGRIVDEVTYRSSWFGKVIPDGVSLEIKDLNFLCSKASNWGTSEDVSGGTPGLRNSIYLMDSLYPALVMEEVIGLKDTLLRIKITGGWLEKVIDLNNVEFSPEWQVDSALISEGELLLFGNNFLLQPGFTNLTISEVHDCELRQYPELSFGFVVPEKAARGDIVINELLFNPTSIGEDFVEVYNASDKYLDLNGWKISSLKSSGPPDMQKVTDQYTLLSPYRFMAFTKNITDVLAEFPQAENMMEMDLPSFTDQSGTVMLLSEDDSVMDVFPYDEDLHLSIIDDKEGVSLERISSFIPATTRSNWHSASSMAGKATPGYRNSQALVFGDEPGAFSIEPDIISPDNDGFDDVAVIRYQNAEPTMVGTVKVFDQFARSVRTLANNEILESEGSIIWDGLSEDGRQLQTGYYLVTLDAFNEAGRKWKQRATIVIAYP